jgi:hypothetical protein
MQSDARAADVPTMAEGAETWSALCATVRQREQLDARIIELTGRLQRSGTIEAIEGVTLDTALNLVHRQPAAERSMLLTAADVLADMPATMALFQAGTLSWGQVRGIVAEAKRLAKDDRAVLDEYVDASTDLFAKLDPDDAVDAVRIVVEELRGLRKAEQREDRLERGSFVWAQASMFGRGKIYGELDNLSLAQVLARVDAMAPADDGRTLSQRRADGLVNLATHDCDTGGEGTGRGAETTIVVCLDKDQATPTAAGTIVLDAPGCLPTVTARTIEALVADASVQAVVFDGGRPLTATAKIRAKTIPAATRAAVKARDRGDRFPGSRRPLQHVHHLDKKGQGHHPEFLVGLSQPSHTRVHRFGWSVKIDPATAEATFKRGERTWVTVPRDTRLRRPRPKTTSGDADGDPHLPAGP